LEFNTIFDFMKADYTKKNLYYNWNECHDFSKPTHKVLTASFLLNDKDIESIKNKSGMVFCQNEYWEIDTPLESLVSGINRIVLTRTL